MVTDRDGHAKTLHVDPIGDVVADASGQMLRQCQTQALRREPRAGIAHRNQDGSIGEDQPLAVMCLVGVTVPGGEQLLFERM